MSTLDPQQHDQPRDEYDFSSGSRGKYATRYSRRPALDHPTRRRHLTFYFVIAGSVAFLVALALSFFTAVVAGESYTSRPYQIAALISLLTAVASFVAAAALHISRVSKPQ